MMASPRHRNQKGVFSIFAALGVLMIIGCVGLAIDTGRMMVVRSELQTAADACALAGAFELNGQSDAARRATAAGRYVGGQRNRSDFQVSPVAIPTSGVTFPTNLSDSVPPTADTANGAAARIVRCTVTSPGIAPLLLSALGVGNLDVTVRATATVQSAQSVCAIPMAIMGNISAGANYGYTAGERIVLGETGTQGFFQWANVADDPRLSGLDDYGNAFINYGSCGAPTEVGRCIRVHNGQVSSIDQYWNARFGVYKSRGLTPADAVPDLTGYAFPEIGTSALVDYQTIYAPRRTPTQASAIPRGYSSPANVNSNYGAPYRRLVVMPVINAGDTSCGGTNGARRLIGWACALMIRPISSSQYARAEYIGPANAADTPCRTAGVPGSFAGNGPLVPVLVQ